MNLNFAADLNEKYEGLCTRLDKLTEALHSFPHTDQTHSVQMREWEPFVLFDGGVTDSSTGNVTIGGTNSPLAPAPNGWEAYLFYVAVTVGGASSAATVELYRGGSDGSHLLDYASGMFGSSPSRTAAEYTRGHYFRDSEHVSVVISGAVTSQQATVRIEGHRRQV